MSDSHTHKQKYQKPGPTQQEVTNCDAKMNAKI